MGVDEKIIEQFDTVVVGAGGAGLWTSLKAAETGRRVAVVSRSPLSQSSSFWAQGGLAAAIASSDSPAAHLKDTLTAGRDASRVSAAQILVGEAPQTVLALADAQVSFDREKDGTFKLGLEGGHSNRRIVHAGGSETGRHVSERLAQLAKAEPNITIFEGVAARSLWMHEGRCVGVLTDNADIAAAATVLATGGAAALWERSTNPPSSTGSGLMMAHTAGAELADLEFVQFHPTALARPRPGKFDGFLISEAVRGEGAKLLNRDGENFVDELAPRDEVARAILRQGLDQHARGQPRSVNLDMRAVKLDLFPNVVDVLRQVGFDPAHELIPVYPAAHYVMGGIATDHDGRTSLPGLYAVGECACTGLHGANRLASNSLSECFVFGMRAALAAAAERRPARPSSPDPVRASEPITASSRQLLWQFAGLERDAKGLKKLLSDPHPLVRLIGQAGLMRKESRGAHYRVDNPLTDRSLDHRHIVIDRDGETSLEKWS